MKNIVLIGMPGCGKSTIGRMLAAKYNMQFLDMDDLIEQKGMSIDELFDIGEKVFRDVESQVAKELRHHENSVISTGGGVIVRKENTDYLRENGIIVFIDRPMGKINNDIRTSTRPLLRDKQNALVKLYAKRYPLYMDQSDIRIENDKKLYLVVEEIQQAIESMEV